MKKSDFYFWAGVFFVLLQIVAIARNLYFDFVYFFWFYDFVPFILAIAFFLRRDEVIKGIVNIGLFPQLIYTVSFIARVFFGVQFLSDIEVVLGYNAFVIFSSIFLHLASVIAFGFSYRVKPKGRDLSYSLFGLVLIYIMVAVFTMPTDSINYVFLLSNFFGIDALSIFWVPITFFVVVLPTQWFRHVIYRYFGK